MKDPRINFRSRELAALLAFLIPGAGHFYQGRRLKAGIYFTGILSLFFAGMVLGDWQPVYSQVAYGSHSTSLQMQEKEARMGTDYYIGYGAQVFVGLPALPSIIQQSRFKADEGALHALDGELNSEFTGIIHNRNSAIPVTGQLNLTPSGGGSVGAFDGKTLDGQDVSISIDGPLKLGRKVFGSPRREIELRGLTAAEDDPLQPFEMSGYVSRPFIDWYQAPRDNAELDRLHGKLSQNFDIACVFTWIAGLLNLMAIWDAYDGPAYGYGDEEPDEEEGEADSEKSKSP